MPCEPRSCWPELAHRPRPPIDVRERRRRPRLLWGMPVQSFRQLHQPPVGATYASAIDDEFQPDERSTTR